MIQGYWRIRVDRNREHRVRVGLAVLAKTICKGEALIGDHSREAYVRLLSQLILSRFTGLLTVSFGSHERVLGFFSGQPIFYDSNLQEDELGRTLVQSRLVPEDRMRWIAGKMDDDEELEDVVVITGTLSSEKLVSHFVQRVRMGVGAPLRWGTGRWEIQPFNGLEDIPLHPDLLPGVEGMGALWQGVHAQVSVDEVFPLLSLSQGVDFRPDRRFEEIFSCLEVNPPLDRLTEVMGSGTTTAEIFKQIPDATGTLPRLLWFLEVGGVLERDPAAAEAVTTLRGVLGLSISTPDFRVGVDVRAAEPATQVVVEVMDSADQDEAGTGAHDEQAEAGHGTLNGAVTVEDETAKPTAEDARACIDRGEFKAAISILESVLDEGHGYSDVALRANRETPGLLADLAWCLWRGRDELDSEGADALRDEAESLIGRALELNSKDLRTLVYRARMALEDDDRENAVAFLRRILLLEPEHDWALAYLAEQEASPKQKGIFGLFKGRNR